MGHNCLVEPWKYTCEPFKVADHIFYIGNTWVASYLLDSGDGLVLIDCGIPQGLYQLFDNIRILGYNPKDIKHLLITHAHYDHAGAAEAIRQYTGAKIYLGKEDIPYIGCPDLTLSELSSCPPFTVDEIYNDTQTIHIGRFDFQAIHTPGHTMGARSLFFDAEVNRQKVLCGIHGGLGFNTMKDEYLQKMGIPVSIRDTFYKDLERLSHIPVQLELASHPERTRMLEKRLQQTSDNNPFVDDTTWKWLMEDRIRAFRDFFNIT